LSEEYRQVHDSEAGLGDLILAAYDRTAGLVDARRRHLQTMEPNFGATDPMQFVISGLDGKKLGLGSLKGRIVIMDFWATWCVPCRTQHPMYETVKERFKDRSDVVFLAIDADEERLLVEPFLDAQKWSRTAVYFEDGLQRLLKVDSIPTTIMFDKRGRLWSRMNGFAPDRFVETLTERIQTALAANERE
jgi:thiol-disulfide isomerase/thioredoxin